MKGRGSWRIRELHEKYGLVVRIAPDELSYTTSTAWKKIYGQKTPEFGKCLDGRGIAPTSVNGVKSMMTEEQDRHGRLRRAILPAFSERSVREQEGFLQRYTDKMVEQLRKRCAEPQNMTKWYSLVAFDVVSDLAFGQASGCLDNADQPWLQVIGARAKSLVWFQMLMQLGLEPYMDRIMPKWAAEARKKHLKLTGEKVNARIARGAEDRKDFMSYILDSKTENLNNTELVIMASTFIVAGSGTAAGGMSGITFLLCQNPDKYRKLCDEIRSTFTRQEDITIQATSHCEYLKAVIDEGLRMYPPTPSTLPRWVPKGGQEIDGKYVPGGVSDPLTYRESDKLTNPVDRLRWASINSLQALWSGTSSMPDHSFLSAGWNQQRTQSSPMMIELPFSRSRTDQEAALGKSKSARNHVSCQDD